MIQSSNAIDDSIEESQHAIAACVVVDTIAHSPLLWFVVTIPDRPQNRYCVGNLDFPMSSYFGTEQNVIDSVSRLFSIRSKVMACKYGIRESVPATFN